MPGPVIPVSQPSARVVEFDSLRGLAALAVLVAHLFGEPEHGFEGLTVGWLGVGVFFALSGYLIGGIILNDHEKPSFLRNFMVRRAARILPLYFAIVALTLGAAVVLSSRSWTDAALHPAAYVTFTQNFFMAFGHDSGSWLLPTWTVAVEQQFYLLLPLLMMTCPRRRLLPALVILCVASVLYRVIYYPLNTEAATMLLPGRADTLLYGVIAAYARRSFDLSRRHNLIWGISLMAAAALAALLAFGDYRLIVIVSPALVGLATAALLLMISLRQPDPRQTPSPILRWFGAISYGLYLIHQPINGLLHGLILDARPDVGTPPQILVTLLAAAISIILAWLSWRWFETPILEWSRRTTMTAQRQVSAAT